MIRIPDEKEQHAFCDEAIHAWLSALDGEYQPAALKMTLAEFATAFAESRGPGLRRFSRPSATEARPRSTAAASANDTMTAASS
jgi:hypothetical protein